MTQNFKPDRQREHQANERTFLAWLRTAVALIALGLATARFGLFLRELESAIIEEFPLEESGFNSQALGLSLVLFGLVVIALAAWRYQQVFWQIEKGNYKPSQRLVWLMVVAVMILATLSTLPLLLSSF